MIDRLKAYYFFRYHLHWSRKEAWFGSKSKENELKVVRKYAGLYEKY